MRFFPESFNSDWFVMPARGRAWDMLGGVRERRRRGRRRRERMGQKQ